MSLMQDQQLRWQGWPQEDQCSSFKDDQVEMKWSAQVKYMAHRVFYFTGIILSREVLDWIQDTQSYYQQGKTRCASQLPSTTRELYAICCIKGEWQ